MGKFAHAVSQVVVGGIVGHLSEHCQASTCLIAIFIIGIEIQIGKNLIVDSHAWIYVNTVVVLISYGSHQQIHGWYERQRKFISIVFQRGICI